MGLLDCRSGLWFLDCCAAWAWYMDVVSVGGSASKTCTRIRRNVNSSKCLNIPCVQPKVGHGLAKFLMPAPFSIQSDKTNDVAERSEIYSL